MVGLVFAAYGCYESLKMTYKMVSGKLLPCDAERYVAMMLESTVISVLVGRKLKKMQQTGAENDAAFWASSADDQATYLMGQGAVPKKVWNQLVADGLGGQTHPEVLARGQELQQNFGPLMMKVKNLQGLAEMLKNQATGGGMTFTQWLDTGLTPDFRVVFGEYGAGILGSISASVHGVGDWLFG